MKVRCITKPVTYIGKRSFYTAPEVGDECTVIKVVRDDLDIKDMYELAEYPGFKYCTRHFAILPSTTEEIAVECETESIIYQR